MFESLAYRKHAAFVFVSQGVDEGPDGLKLISDVIQEKLGITMSVLMGANIANEVADEKFCETTIGQYGQISFRLV